MNLYFVNLKSEVLIAVIQKLNFYKSFFYFGSAKKVLPYRLSVYASYMCMLDLWSKDLCKLQLFRLL